MTISKPLTEFFGKPVKDFAPGEDLDVKAFAPRLRLSYDDHAARATWRSRLEAFLKTPGAGATTHLVAGAYEGFEGDMDAKMAIEPLVEHRAELPDLEALFLGDITYEECEISWILEQDAEPILRACPDLRAFGLRGRVAKFGAHRLPRLESLILQNSGLTKANAAEVFALEAPALSHLELWTGSEDYGAETDVEDLEPLLKGEVFPKLTHLALRDSAYADAIARAVVQAPIFARLEILDLSLGTLGDEGGAALLEALPGSNLKRLILDHHYMSEALTAKFAALGARVSVAERREEEEYGRYVAVGE